MLVDKSETLCSQYAFKDVQYNICVKTTNENKLIVSVVDNMNEDKWESSFSKSYVEELTRKTGNFKHFSIFLSMLETALKKSSDSVTLDLLTFSDLQDLRNKKFSNKKVLKASKQQENRRYLILVYSVEFDRIHYPLPLQHIGKPSATQLQKTVNRLNKELSILKTKTTNQKFTDAYEQLRTNDLVQEKNNLHKAYNLLVNKTKVSSTEAKNVKLLKKVIQNLEHESLKQKNKFQRQLSRKCFECKTLETKVNEISAKERSLRLKVNSLTRELNFYKKCNSSSTNIRSSVKSKRSLSRGRSFHSSLSSKECGRSSSLEKFKTSSVRKSSKAYSCSSSRSSRGSINSYIQKNKGNFSNTRKPPICEKSSSINNRAKSQTPSYRSFRRFNPTEYHEEKRKKLKQSQEKRLRDVSSKFLNSLSDNVRKKNKKSEKYFSDKNSSVENRRSAGIYSHNRFTQPYHSCDNSLGDHTRENSFNELNMISRSPLLKTKSSLKLKSSQSFDDIDQRLNALQQYMLEIDKK